MKFFAPGDAPWGQGEKDQLDDLPDTKVRKILDAAFFNKRKGLGLDKLIRGCGAARYVCDPVGKLRQKVNANGPAPTFNDDASNRLTAIGRR